MVLLFPGPAPSLPSLSKPQELTDTPADTKQVKQVVCVHRPAHSWGPGLPAFLWPFPSYLKILMCGLAKLPHILFIGTEMSYVLIHKHFRLSPDQDPRMLA